MCVWGWGGGEEGEYNIQSPGDVNKNTTSVLFIVLNSPSIIA